MRGKGIMRNKKFWLLVVITMLLVITMTFLFVACNNNKPENPTPNPGGDPGEEDEWEEGGDNVTSDLSAMDMFSMIGKGVKVPDQVFHINAYVDIQHKTDIFRLDFFLTMKSDKENQLKLEVKKLGSKSIAAAAAKQNANNNISGETQASVDLTPNVFNYNVGLADSQADEIVFGFYAINADAFLNVGAGKPILKLEDFNMNYTIEILKKAISLVGGSLDGLLSQGTVANIIGLVMGMICPEKAVPVVDEVAQTVSYDLKIDVNNFLNSLNSLLSAFDVNGLLAGLGVSLGFDIGQLVNHIVGIVPKIDMSLKTTFDNNDKSLQKIEMVVKNNDATQGEIGANLLTLSMGLNISDTAEEIEIPEIVNYVPFSFTNIRFDIDLLLNTSDKIDVGQLINSLAMKTILPENLLMAEIKTGLRLSVNLDLDLNYDKSTIDNNLIALEIYLLNPELTAEADPAVGLYYKDSKAYLNLGNLVPNYYKGKNIEIDINLDEIIQTLVTKIVTAIDSGLGTDGSKYFGGGVLANSNNVAAIQDLFTKSLNQNEATNLILGGTPTFEPQKDANGNVIYNNGFPVYKIQNNTTPVFSIGVQNFFNGLFDIMLSKQNQDFITMDDNTIKIKFNNAFLSAIQGMIGMTIPFTLPDAIKDIELKVNFEKGKPLDSIVATAKLGTGTSTLSGDLKIHNLGIGYEDADLEKRVEDAIKSAESTGHTSSVRALLDTILGGTHIQAGLSVEIKKGKYNLATLLAHLGMPFLLKDDNTYEEVMWEVTHDFKADLQLVVQLALDKNNSASSQMVVEIKTGAAGIAFGGNHKILVAPNTTLIGLYYYNNNIYIDASGIKILGISLPKLVINNLNLTAILNGFLGSLDINLSQTVNDLLSKIGLVTKQDMSGNEELNGGGDVQTNALSNDFGNQSIVDSGLFVRADGSPVTAADSLADVKLSQLGEIFLAVSSSSITASLSFGAIKTLLTGVGVDLSAIDGLELPVGAELSLSRNDGFTFRLEGDICKSYNENGQLVFNNGLALKLEIGTPGNPISIGSLAKPDGSGSYSYNMQSIIGNFNQYEKDLVQAIVNTVGKSQLDASIKVSSQNVKYDLQGIINRFMAAQGSSFPIPITLEFDEGEIELIIALKLGLDLNNAYNTKVDLKISYIPNGSTQEKTLLRFALLNGSVIADLRGLGLIQFEMVNSPITDLIVKVFGDLVNDIGSLNLSELITDLVGEQTLKDLIDDSPSLSGSGDGGYIEIGETPISGGDMGNIFDGIDTKYQDIIKALLTGMSNRNDVIAFKFGADALDKVFSSLLGSSLGLHLEASAEADLINGEVNVGLKFDHGAIDAALKLKFSTYTGEWSPDIDRASIPDWDASSGEQFAKDLLNNLDVNLVMDWKSSTSATIYHHHGPQYTRLTFEKLKSDRVLTNTKSNPVAKRGTFLITLGFNNKANYNNNNQGSFNPLVYIMLDPLASVNNARILLVKGHLVVINIVDIGNFIDIFISLDLVGMLSDLFQGLFDQLNTAVVDTPQAASSGGGIIINKLAEEITAAAEPNGEMADRTYPKTFDEIFSNLDVISLLTRKIINADGVVVENKGIEAKISTDGTLTARVNFNPYLLNKLIDDMMFLVFGPGTVIDIRTVEMIPGTRTFEGNYMAWIKWSRISQNAFYNSLAGALRAGNWIDAGAHKGLLIDLIWNGLGVHVNVGGLIGGLVGDIQKMIMKLLPLSVFSDAYVDLTVADGTIAKVAIALEDRFDNYDSSGRYLPDTIHIDNDARNKMLAGLGQDQVLSGDGVYNYNVTNNNRGKIAPFSKHRGGSRTDQTGAWGEYFNDGRRQHLDQEEYPNYDGAPFAIGTYITISNLSDSVGWDVNNNTANGVVIWDVPSKITYDPYQYLNKEQGLKATIDSSVIGKQPSYLNGYNFQLQRASFITAANLKMVSFTPLNGAAQTISGTYSPDKIAESGGSVTPGTYKIRLDVTFAGQSTRYSKEIDFVVLNKPATVTQQETIKNSTGQQVTVDTIFETIEIHAYDNEPISFGLRVSNGQGGYTVRRIPADKTRLAPDPGYSFAPTTFREHYSVNTITLPDGTRGKIVIHYLDSTIASGITGRSNEIDVHTEYMWIKQKDKYDPHNPQNKTTEEYVKELVGENDGNLYFRYDDGGTGYAIGTWDVQGKRTLQTEITRRIALFESADPARQLELLNGFSCDIGVSVGTGGLKQSVNINIVILPKLVESVVIGGNDYIEVDAYQYYLYTIYSERLAEWKREDKDYAALTVKLNGYEQAKTDLETKIEPLKNALVLDDMTGNLLPENRAEVEKKLRDFENELERVLRYISNTIREQETYIEGHEQGKQLRDLVNEYNPYPSEVLVYFYQKISGKDYRYSETVHVDWGTPNAEELSKYDWRSDLTFQKKLSLDASQYPNASVAWSQNVSVRVTNNQITGLYFDEAMTQKVWTINPFSFANNAENNVNNYPSEAYARFVNGSVYKLPIAWKKDIFDYVPSYELDTIQTEICIGYDETKYTYGEGFVGGSPVAIQGLTGALQQYNVKVVVEQKVAMGIDVDGSELNPNTKFVIDPIKYHFNSDEQGLYKAFPKEVKVRYMDGSEEMLNAQWVGFNSQDIVLGGKKNLVATCKLTSDVSFDINVEVMDKSSFALTTNQYSLEVVDLDNDAVTNHRDLTYTQAMNIVAGLTDSQVSKLYPQIGIDALDFVVINGVRTYTAFGEQMNFTSFDGKYDIVITYSEGAETRTKNISVSSQAEHDAVKEEHDALYVRDANYTFTATKVMTEYVLDSTWDLSKLNYTPGYSIAKLVLKSADEAKYDKAIDIIVEVENSTFVRIGEDGSVLYLNGGGNGWSDHTSHTSNYNVTVRNSAGALVNKVFEGRIDLSSFGRTNYTMILEDENNYGGRRNYVPLLFRQDGSPVTVVDGQVKIYEDNGILYHINADPNDTNKVPVDNVYTRSATEDISGLKQVNGGGAATLANTAMSMKITLLYGTALSFEVNINVHVYQYIANN